MSFEALLLRLSPTLKRITRRLNGHFSFMDDQDLFQEAVLHLWTCFTSGELNDKTDSYVLQGCYYHLKNHIRKARDGETLLSLSGMSEDDGANLEEILSAGHISLHDKVEGDLQIAAIVESGVSEREKDVLLFSLEGMTTREIGLRLGVSHVSVVKTRNKLRERYEKLYGIRHVNVAGQQAGKAVIRVASECRN